MNIYTGFDGVKDIHKAVVTTGSFDGVHVGHKAIINRLKNIACNTGGETVLVTFYPHPRRVLYPDTEGKGLKLINTQEEKIELLRETGLDNLIIVPFTLEFSHITSFEFVTNYLLAKLHAHVIVVGFNHHFGFNREGNYQYLYNLSKKFGFSVEEIPVQEIQNESVSSTKIRKALSEGNIQRANAYLDNFFFITGPLQEGNKTLTRLGFPTLTIGIYEEEKLVPPQGVYAVRLRLENHFYKGMANILHPEQIDNNGCPFIEFYLLESAPAILKNTTGTLYFHKRVRDVMHFDTPEKLRDQLVIDRETIGELIY